MFIDFDRHRSTGRFAVLRSTERRLDVVVLDIASGERFGEVPGRFLPLSPRFSPDGDKVVCFGNGRVYLHRVTDGATETVVDLPGWHSGFPALSPDAGSLAFSAYGVPSDPENSPPRVFLLDLANRTTEQVPPGNRHSADLFPQWNPTSRSLALQRRLYEPAGINSDVVLVDRASLETKHLPTEDGWNQMIGRCCWSHDGAHILVMESLGDNLRRLAAFPADGGNRVWSLEETGTLAGCFDPYRPRVLCITDESLRLFEFPSGDPVAVLQLEGLSPIRSKRVGPTVAFDPEADAVYFLDRAGRLLCWRVGDGAEVVLEDQPPELAPAYERQDYWFTARDGRDIPVQMYVPRRQNGRVIVYVQGGPGGEIDDSDPVALRLLDEGYQLLRPAYRGTSGYGADHERANRGEWGRTDVWDIVDCGLDWKRCFPGDTRPIALAGFSYGGFLTFLASTYPDAPYSCAVTLWGVTRFLPRFLTLPAEEMERAKSERSPVSRASDIRVPLLMLHGGRDTTATTDDVRTIRDSVRESGVPCELVVFGEDTHALQLSRPAMFRHMLEFLDTHLPQNPRDWRAPAD